MKDSSKKGWFQKNLTKPAPWRVRAGLTLPFEEQGGIREYMAEKLSTSLFGPKISKWAKEILWRAREEQASQAPQDIWSRQASKVDSPSDEPVSYCDEGTGDDWEGDVLTDLALLELAPDMSETEKLFTTIKWIDDSLSFSTESFDSVTLDLISKNKDGDGTYFSWAYIDEEDIKELEKRRIAEDGFTFASEPSLCVDQKPAWKNIQQAVAQRRRELAE